jgi:hypothetical protein
MITIEQLLEFVDLDFEPRWVTKDIDGSVLIWDSKTKPVVVTENRQWERPLDEGWEYFGAIKLAEFADKDWQECIYEVPRTEELKDKIKIGTLYIDKNVTFGDGDDDDVGVAPECCEVPRKADEYEQNLEKLRPADSDLVYRVNLPRKTTGNEIEQKMLAELERKLNAIVDAAIEAVNELKGAKNE